MLRSRLLILLGGCLLAVSTVWANDVGYVDCAIHGEQTQVFGKPRKTRDAVASLPCGERFTVLLYGFIFSRIETKDGKVGYIYSSLITADRSDATAPHGQSAVRAESAVAAPRASATTTQPDTGTPQQVSPALTEAAVSKASVGGSETSASVAGATTRTTPEAEPTAAPAARASPDAAPSRAQAYSDPTLVSPTDAPKATAQPGEKEANPKTVAEREPAPPAIQPAVQPATARERWERPNPTAALWTPKVEFYGGYAFTRFDDGGSGTNLQGGMGSFGWNVKPWLQMVADTSYSMVTLSGTKNVLYGNHYGPRVYPRGRNRLGMSPFVEALFGGSRLDSTVSGASGYRTSDNTFSIKTGGGLDMRLSRYFEVRVVDADYYRTSFGGTSQNNYWISTGIVLRLFGGGSE
jgi:outer membrane immunogenic protein